MSELGPTLEFKVPLSMSFLDANDERYDTAIMDRVRAEINEARASGLEPYEVEFLVRVKTT